MVKNTKQSSPGGTPRFVIPSIDSNGGLQVSYFEDKLLKVPVPTWLDPRGYQEMPSSVALPMLLRGIQHPDPLSRRRDSPKRRRKRRKKMLKHLANTFPDSSRRKELDDAVRVTKAIDDYPTEKLRETALEQFTHLFRRPVAPQRWGLVEPKVIERALENDRLASEEVADAVKVAAPQVRPISTPERSFEASLRQQLNELVTEYLMDSKLHKVYDRGSQLRMQPTEYEALASLAEVEASRGHASEEDQLLGKIAREKFFDGLREVLSPRERELLDVRLSGADYREWAKKEWGWKDSTVDTTMSRVRKKLEELARRRSPL